MVPVQASVLRAPVAGEVDVVVAAEVGAVEVVVRAQPVRAVVTGHGAGLLSSGFS
ncbi:MAG TPA: hypothetical protein VFS29_13910 [Motilibacteraceae bacterium]|nr:hypothetical protein [Motilibacteraceae bacterium]